MTPSEDQQVNPRPIPQEGKGTLIEAPSEGIVNPAEAAAVAVRLEYENKS